MWVLLLMFIFFLFYENLVFGYCNVFFVFFYGNISKYYCDCEINL